MITKCACNATTFMVGAAGAAYNISFGQRFDVQTIGGTTTVVMGAPVGTVVIIEGVPRHFTNIGRLTEVEIVPVAAASVTIHEKECS